MNTPIKVLVVDDSKLIRSLLTSIINADPALTVVGEAEDPFDAREKIKNLKPDVLTLDIEMPKMDGITFLKNIMRLRPMPVVMISTLTEKGAIITMQALEIGAVDFIAKPKVSVESQLNALTSEITRKIRYAASANLLPFGKSAPEPKTLSSPSGGRNQKIDLIAIGSSTGGTDALKQVIGALPANMPPIVITQHMPGGFTETFANRLNQFSKLNVSEFSGHTTTAQPNHVYVANGDRHMLVEQRAGQCILRADDSAPVNRHKPSVDVLFSSVSKHYRSNAVGVILTGMGGDGAEGMKLMRDRGSLTIAQDEASSVVWGMPRVAVEKGAACQVTPLKDIAAELVNCCYHKNKAVSRNLA